MIKLSARLKAIANFVDDNSNMVDIGCDHGLLDIYLFQNKSNLSIIASDVNENALNNAKRNIKKYKLSDNIKVVLSDGLNNIDTTGIDTLVISGMGAHTIVGILYKNLKKLKKVEKIIIQSNNDIDFIRYKLSKIDYRITNEMLVEDGGFIYTVIEFKRGFSFYTRKKLYLGPCLLKENSPLFRKKLAIELAKMEKFYPMIPKNNYHHRHKISWRIKVLKSILNK